MKKKTSGEKARGRQPKNNIRPAGAEQKARILKALAHPSRITIFEALTKGEMTVSEIADMLDAKDAITSRHLAVMRSAGLVEARKQGLNVYYSIKLPCLVSMLSCLEDGVCMMADEQHEMAESLRSKTR